MKKKPEKTFSGFVYFFLFLKKIRDIQNQSFRFFPAKAGVGDRFSVNAVFRLLASVFDIAFNHESFYVAFDILRMAAAVKNFFADSYLFIIFFIGVCMVCINNNRHVFQSFCRVHIIKLAQVFIVIVGIGLPVFVDKTSQNTVGEGVAFAFNFPSSVYKRMGVLRCGDRV